MDDGRESSKATEPAFLTEHSLSKQALHREQVTAGQCVQVGQQNVSKFSQSLIHPLPIYHFLQLVNNVMLYFYVKSFIFLIYFHHVSFSRFTSCFEELAVTLTPRIQQASSQHFEDQVRVALVQLEYCLLPDLSFDFSVCMDKTPR